MAESSTFNEKLHGQSEDLRELRIQSIGRRVKKLQARGFYGDEDLAVIRAWCRGKDVESIGRVELVEIELLVLYAEQLADTQADLRAAAGK